MVVFILVDALRSDYINENDMPFLSSFSKKNERVEFVIPSAGFCERTEIFYGLNPLQSGFFTAIGFSPKDSEYSKSYTCGILEYLDAFFEVRNYFLLRKVIRKIYRRIYSGRRMNIYEIPLNILKNFALTEDRTDFLTLKFNSSEGLHAILEKKGMNVCWESFTSLGKDSELTSDAKRLNHAETSMLKGKDLILVYLNNLDKDGHSYGTSCDSFKQSLRSTDSMLEKFYEKTKPLEYKYIFLGDHGMSDVISTVDLNGIILSLCKELNYKPGKEVIFFLDSTMARFWISDIQMRLKFLSELENRIDLETLGCVISSNDYVKNGIPNENRLYGDFLIWLNEGILIYPDFFRRDYPAKGMHGYRPVSKNTYGTLIQSIKNEDPIYSDSIELSDLKKRILNLIIK